MTASGSSAVRVTGLSKSFGDVTALDNLTFEVPEGRFFVLFGPSSVGKTTTLRMIAGLERADTGTLEIFGRDMTHEPIKGRGVSMVFQSFALYPHLTVYENFAYPLIEEKVSRAEIDSRVKETAEMLKLTHRLERKPSTLSGGEQQRVALGRSLIRRPRVLLLDEPLTNLDAKLRHDMRAELKRLHRQFGMTIIYATPDELEALSMGETIAVMRDGAVAQQGGPDELYERPADTYVAGKIGSPHMNMLRATVTKNCAAIDTAAGVLKPPQKLRSLNAGEGAYLGIRPSDIRVAAKGEAAIKSRIHLIEPLGDVTIVSVEIRDEILRMVLPEANASTMQRGQDLSIALDASKFHIFRAADGRAVA